MAQISVETTRIKIRGANGHVHEFCMAYDTEETSGQPLVLVHAYRDGHFAGTPIRFKDADGRIASDRPGVSDDDFITQDGHVTNG